HLPPLGRAAVPGGPLLQRARPRWALRRVRTTRALRGRGPRLLPHHALTWRAARPARHGVSRPPNPFTGPPGPPRRPPAPRPAARGTRRDARLSGCTRATATRPIPSSRNHAVRRRRARDAKPRPRHAGQIAYDTLISPGPSASSAAFASMLPTSRPLATSHT